MGNCGGKYCPSKVREKGICYPNGCDCCPESCNCCCPNGCTCCEPDCCSRGCCKMCSCFITCSCLPRCCKKGGGRKKVKTWRQEYAEEQAEAAKKAKKEAYEKELAEFRADRAEKVKAYYNRRHEPKIGRNGLTWAEKEADKKLIDAKHLDKFARLYYKKPKRSDLTRETWSGHMRVNTGWILQSCFGWQKRFIVMQGHFLYLFASDRPSARCIRVVLLKRCQVQVKGMHEGAYFVIIVRPLTPRRPYVNKSRPSRKLLDGSLQLSASNRIVQEGVAKEFKRASRMRHGGMSGEKQLKAQSGPLMLHSASLGGHQREKHVMKWRRLTKNPPTLQQLGMVEKSGWLEREGGLRNPWLKRFIVLKGHWIYEFTDHMPRAVCKRVVFIGNCRISENRFANNGFTIHSQFSRYPDKIGSEDKDYGIQCGTIRSRQEWQSAIEHNSALPCAGRSKRKGQTIEEEDEIPFQTHMFHYDIG